MSMSFGQGLCTVGVIIAATVLTRFLPFWLFPEGKATPPFVTYLGKVLPNAMIGLLVIYCLRSAEPSGGPLGLPELLGVAVTAALHWWKGNTLLSIGAGTAGYMLLVQWVFC